MSDIHERLAQNIHKLAKTRKVTVERLALDIDKDKAHLSRVLSGKKKANLDLVEKLAGALRVDVQKLFKP